MTAPRDKVLADIEAELDRVNRRMWLIATGEITAEEWLALSSQRHSLVIEFAGHLGEVAAA